MRNPLYSIITWVSIHSIVHTPKKLLCLASTEPECDATSETCSNSDVSDEIIESRDIYSLWNRVKDDHTNELRKLFTDCVDNHEKCGQWEAHGECVNNPHVSSFVLFFYYYLSFYLACFFVHIRLLDSPTILFNFQIMLFFFITVHDCSLPKIMWGV